MEYAPGALLERLVECIQKELSGGPATKIDRNAEVCDLDGVVREIDVLVDTELDGRARRIAIECKDHKHAIKMEAIEAFAMKCARLPADQMAYVSTAGFQRGAKIKAQALGIDLLELAPVSDDADDSQQVSDLIGRIGATRDIVGVGVYCPDSPSEVRGRVRVYMSDRETRASLSDLAWEHVARCPPPPQAVAAGDYVDVTGRFKLEDSTYFAQHGGRFYEVKGIAVTVRFTKGVLVREAPQRLTRVPTGESVAELVAFEMPMLGGVGTTGKVTCCQSGHTSYFIELPRGASLPSEAHLHCMYKVPGSDGVHEVVLPSESRIEDGDLIIKANLTVLPRGAEMLKARLKSGPALPYDWNVMSVAIAVEGEHGEAEADLDTMYRDQDKTGCATALLIDRAFRDQLPPHANIEIGTILVRRALLGFNEPLFVRIGDSRARVLSMTAEVELRRKPLPDERGAGGRVCNSE